VTRRRQAHLDGRRAVARADIRPYASAAMAAPCSKRGLLNHPPNDITEDRGVKTTRAAFSLQLVMSKLQDLSVCPVQNAMEK